MIDRIQKWEDDTKKLLIRKYDELGLRASGEWERSLESSTKKNGQKYTIKFEGVHYTYYMQHGRRPNKKQDKDSINKFVRWAGSTFIKDWLNQKRLAANPFAVAYKIAKEGIKVPNNYNKGGLISDVFTENHIQKLYDIIQQELVIDIKSDLKLFKK